MIHNSPLVITGDANDRVARDVIREVVRGECKRAGITPLATDRFGDNMPWCWCWWPMLFKQARKMRHDGFFVEAYDEGTTFMTGVKLRRV